MQAEVVKLLAMDGTDGLARPRTAYGYHWLVVEDADIEALVTQVHMVNSSLADAGWGPQLLCSVFGLAPLTGATPAEATGAPDTTGDADADRRGAGADRRCRSTGMPAGCLGAHRRARHVRPSTAFLVYLFKRGTFYPVRAHRARAAGHRRGVQAEEPGGRRPGDRIRPRPLVPALGPARRLNIWPAGSAGQVPSPTEPE